MKKTLLIIVLSTILVGCQSLEVNSPDKSLSVRFEQTQNGGIAYSVQRDGKDVITTSQLGFLTDAGALDKGFKLIGRSRHSESSSWETVWGEERVITDKHNALTLCLKHETGIQMNIEFRVFADGFAFRYIFPEQTSDTVHHTLYTINDELTEYRFVQDAEAWSIPWRTEY